MLDSWAAVELWIIECLAVSVLWVLDVLAVSVGCSFLGCFFWALHGCQTHDKRMAFMGHSLRAHAVLMLTHAFGALDLKQMALTSGSCGTHVDSCAQLARHSTGRRRHSGVELTCAMQDQSPPNPVPGLAAAFFASR